MKKLVSLLLAMLMLLGVTAMAEAPVTETTEAPAAFNLSALESSPYYTYDKFQKTWEIKAEWQNDYGSSNGVVLVQLEYAKNYYENGWTPVLSVYFYDYANSHYYKVNAFRVIVGEKLYSFDKMSDGGSFGYAFYGEVMRQLLADLTQAEMIDFQIGFTDKGGRGMNLTISDFNAATQWADIIALGKVFEDANVYTVPANLIMFDLENNASVE